MTPKNEDRYVFRDECRAEAAEVHGSLFSLSILAIADTNRSFTVYSPIGIDKNGKEILVGPFSAVFDDMLRLVR